MNFDPGSSTLTPAAEEVVDQLCLVVRAMQDVVRDHGHDPLHLRIEGHVHLTRHARDRGLATSLLRARAIASRMARSGVSEDILHPVGLGDASVPISATRPGENRRAHVFLMTSLEIIRWLQGENEAAFLAPLSSESARNRRSPASPASPASSASSASSASAATAAAAAAAEGFSAPPAGGRRRSMLQQPNAANGGQHTISNANGRLDLMQQQQQQQQLQQQAVLRASGSGGSGDSGTGIAKVFRSSSKSPSPVSSSSPSPSSSKQQRPKLKRRGTLVKKKRAGSTLTINTDLYGSSR